MQSGEAFRHMLARALEMVAKERQRQRERRIARGS